MSTSESELTLLQPLLQDPGADLALSYAERHGAVAAEFVAVAAGAGRCLRLYTASPLHEA